MRWLYGESLFFFTQYGLCKVQLNQAVYCESKYITPVGQSWYGWCDMSPLNQRQRNGLINELIRMKVLTATVTVLWCDQNAAPESLSITAPRSNKRLSRGSFIRRKWANKRNTSSKYTKRTWFRIKNVKNVMRIKNVKNAFFSSMIIS